MKIDQTESFDGADDEKTENDAKISIFQQLSPIVEWIPL